MPSGFTLNPQGFSKNAFTLYIKIIFKQYNVKIEGVDKEVFYYVSKFSDRVNIDIKLQRRWL